MKRIVAAVLLAIFWLADAPSALGADGWWTGTIRTVYTHDSGIVRLRVNAPVPQEHGIQCGDQAYPNIQLRRAMGTDGASKFEVMYENLANGISTGTIVSLYLRERTFSDGSTYCLIGEVGDYRPQQNVGTGTTTGGGSTNRIQISTSAPSPVQPLQFITLAVAGGTAGAEYDVLIDLSGTGAFSAEDTVEVAAVKDAEGSLLVASPLPEAFAAEGNAARSFAVRVRRRGSATVSNTLTLTLGETNVPSSLAGHPTVLMDMVLKGVYVGSDDPLLAVEAGAIEPGRSVRSARALGLSTGYSDAQAAALLRSLFDTEIVAPAATGARSGRFLTAAGQRSASVRCLVPAACAAIERLVGCAGNAMQTLRDDRLERCARREGRALYEAFFDFSEKVSSVGNLLRGIAPRMARAFGLGRRPTQTVHDINAAVRQGVGLNKTFRTVTERAEALEQNFRALRDTTKTLTEDLPDHVPAAEREIAADGVDDNEREAFFALVEEADHHYSDAAAFEDEELEDVYTGEADVTETLGTVSDGGGGTSGGATCASGYQEFPVDDKTSTCVWESLVEPHCYAGSRRVTHPDLGGANDCLYYSLDYFQPDGTCRENYAKVTFQGRDTCRWEELGTDKVAWYTLEVEYGVESPQIPVPPDAACVAEDVRRCESHGGVAMCGVITYGGCEVGGCARSPRFIEWVDKGWTFRGTAVCCIMQTGSSTHVDGINWRSRDGCIEYFERNK